ncbi:aspartoacylase [Vibrio sp. SCSIO 43132]|uniref:aspartoacylase n=1 Tax=Vibrio sp. SCSIO 43132 TaxID=2779363 RepID=UPI001CA8F831|nr:aspartoacylase [Vibrio sp. SCSIO 43132]UAB72477.1 aspartoacylase [Vibrio sp. SCSIO 43132]
MDKVNQVLLVSGTHGNELSGIYLHKLIKDGLYPASRDSFSFESIIANPLSMEQNCRFVDHDLNRLFSSTTPEEEPDSHEVNLAKQLKDKYSEQSNQLVIDLHNTTSNMGATLILLADSPFYQQMGAYVKQRMPNAYILFESQQSWDEHPYLCTLGQHGVMIEVGAQAHGSLKSDTLDLMKTMLTAVLDFVENHNLNRLPALNNYDAFYLFEEVKIPLDETGMRIATVHPTICGRDFEAVKPGDPILSTFAGGDYSWEGKHDVYPHFINESAYCKSNIAMALAKKKQVKVG